LLKVNKESFIPKPKVDSVVIEFTKNKKKNAINEQHFYKLVRDSFKQKRKTLKNNLKEYDFEKIMEILNKYKFDDRVRAEQISIDVFVEISNYLTKNKC
jgi:16S rRNA (adenine1518-N6/adenine1519-N6)-dimethyltransferase